MLPPIVECPRRCEKNYRFNPTLLMLAGSMFKLTQLRGQVSPIVASVRIYKASEPALGLISIVTASLARWMSTLQPKSFQWVLHVSIPVTSKSGFLQRGQFLVSY